MPIAKRFSFPFACAAFLIAAQAYPTLQNAAHAESETPVIAIIIDDMGDRLESGLRAARLPGPVATSILPDTPFSVQLAEAAYQSGKEVMLHLPMESTQGKRLGPGAVTLHMTQTEFLRTVEHNLAAVPHVVGINNHMGSLLTQHPGHMRWLMEAMQAYPGLYFIDSRTIDRTVAEQMARELRISNSRRDVFLDDDPSPKAVAFQFDRLVALAHRKGSAIGIGHPHATTLELLEERLPKLARRHGVKLVTVSHIINLRQREDRLWHASSSPSPTAARNSKPLPSSICCAAPGSTSSLPALKTAR